MKLKALTEDKEKNLKNRTLRPSPRMGDTAYYRDPFNKVVELKVDYQSFGDAQALYNAQNYYLSKELAETVAKAVRVKQNLLLFARELDRDYLNPPKDGYTISYNGKTEEFELGATGEWSNIGEVVFETEEGAMKAIKKFNKELRWYFTKASYIHGVY